MLNMTLERKVFNSYTSKEKIAGAISERLKSRIAANHATNLGNKLKDAVNAVEITNANEKKDRNSIKEAIRAYMKQDKIFKLSDNLLDELTTQVLSRNIKIKLIQIKDQNDPMYLRYLESVPEKTKTAILRAVDGKVLIGLAIEETFNGKTLTDLASIFIAIDKDHVWCPNTVSAIEFSNGDKVSGFEISELIRPIIDKLVEGYADKGVVNVEGPRGGTNLIGEVYTRLNRDAIPAKQIELSNGYKIHLFS